MKDLKIAMKKRRNEEALGAGRLARTVVALAALALLTAEASAAPPSRAAAHGARRYICPIDGGHTVAVGDDGKSSLRRYSDLEQPTRAYTNLVLACPKCGYANWKASFETPPSATAVHYVRSHFRRSAKKAANDPVVAYQHHLNLLHLRRAPLREQIGAALFYTYVLKRKRPYGGLDPKLERKLVKARIRVAKLLKMAMKNDPPTRARGRLEWEYLIGELQRLTGKPKAGVESLQSVCKQKRKAGHTIGRLSCEMAHRATNGETWEDYRDGVFDVRGIESAEKQAKKVALQAKAAEIAAKKRAADEAKAKAAAEKVKAAQEEARAREEAKAAERRNKAAQPKGKDAAPGDPLAPPPPPTAK